MVDEFQDTNQLQYKWLQLLVGRQGAIFAVGDDDQSIYSFRGAKVSNMQAFIRDFNAPEPLKFGAELPLNAYNFTGCKYYYWQ